MKVKTISAASGTTVNSGDGRCFLPSRWIFCLFIFAFYISSAQNSGTNIRMDVSLNNSWQTVADDHNKNAFDGFEMPAYSVKNWKTVQVPHNWDGYEGYRRMRHGNRHGYAWYRKTFLIKPQQAGSRYFLFFEGVGSYATVWLNGKKVGAHAGGRTTFTIDITGAIHFSRQNVLAVRADHPAEIHDLPWVCGGCSDERGFSEGSQPLGIFRPVHLLVTNEVRIEPFGVHVWNEATVTMASSQLHFETEIKNYGRKPKAVTVINKLLDKNGVAVARTSSPVKLKATGTAIIKQRPPVFKNARLWSLEDPYLYTLITEIIENGKTIDRLATPYGIRHIRWLAGNNGKQFLLNGKAVFINGIAEYEHLMGASHAFSGEQVRSRVLQMRAAGFNAFRDAHHPHNLRYQNYWDSLGLLWWTQMGAHIWYDSPEFRNNFKTLLKEWVKERRNSPSLVLWGLQNESKLPEDFAAECTQIIRALDPTTSSQRLVTTCNGGSGTDWDVPQNWTGTYGGDPNTYASDIVKQVLIGEYGAWRTLGLHSEDHSYKSNVYSEERMTQLMEMKVRLGEEAKDSTSGHFMWLFTSHDNPGRVQGGEGYREYDRIGPVNYKGLLTPWEEPLDVYYMYRSNYAPKLKEPMVYIASHSWPNRWLTAGLKNNIVVYSNCDEVELFNDVHGLSLGKRKKHGTGTHFQWDNAEIRYNVLYAIGYVNGKEVAKDTVVLHHLPQAPHFNEFFKGANNITKPQPGYNYLYRVNCGGGDFVDENKNNWLADRERADDTTWGSVSWADNFAGMPSFFASQQRTFDPVRGSKDWKLFQTFRFGRDELKYYFPVKDGEYLVEFYFMEPWLGTGGGMDCKGWRVFDVAINGKTVLNDLDIWNEAGHDGALKKMVKAKITGGQLVISFPQTAAGQAMLSAIAIASTDKTLRPAPSPEPIFNLKEASGGNWSVQHWLDLGDQQFTGRSVSFSSLPPELFGAEWLKSVTAPAELPAITLTRDADVFVGIDTLMRPPLWLSDFTDAKSFMQNDANNTFRIYKKRWRRGEAIAFGKMEAAGVAKLLIMARPASNIEPAYDLKTVSNYKAVNARWKGPFIIKGQVDGKDRVIFQNASAENVLEWNFSVGVADRYSLTVSYNNPKTETMKGKLQLLAADGTLMKEEEVVFTPTRQGKSNYIDSNTGTMINAGNYTLRLTSPAAEGLSVNALDVQ